MQTSKFPLWICALVLGGSLTLRADDTPAQAAARAALLQQLQQMQGDASATTQSPVPAETAPAAPAAPAPVVVEPTPAAPDATVVVPTPPPAVPTPAVEPAAGQTGDTEAQAQARAALGQKMAEVGTPATPTVITATTSPVGVATTTTTSLQPITAPPLPINMSKAGKLDWLLSQYKADQITPEQYHTQRAKILAEP